MTPSEKPPPAWWVKFIEDALWREARASVALDKDSEVHTCCDTCTKGPHCPGNRPKLRTQP